MMSLASLARVHVTCGLEIVAVLVAAECTVH